MNWLLGVVGVVEATGVVMGLCDGGEVVMVVDRRQYYA